MALTPGTRLGPYEIVAAIGAGGMGEVYRATDSNLKRPVAIKVLPASVAGDADRLARFQREAEVLASLNHPGIAAVYGLERTADLTALVMELVEGADLSQRIAQGAIPLDEALPIARQIADALEAAHEQGIIHRDLKPANIKVRPDGTVKVLDFGLAKALATEAANAPAGSMSMSPTLTTPAMTQAGMILGTAAYMAPEQARGKSVDKRADIWAFGCVLAEMLTGHRAFGGDETLDVLAAVVSREADVSGLPPSTPPALRSLLSRCLEKDPRRRLRDMGEARLALESAAVAVPDHTPARETPGPMRRWAVPVALLLGGVSGVLAATLWFAEGTPDAVTRSPLKFAVEAPPGGSFVTGDVSISPDGKLMVFVAEVEGKRSLWVRAMSAGTLKVLPGTEGAVQPFWSPDSASLAFFADRSLKALEVATGTVRVICEGIAGPGGGTWSRDGVIVFSPRLEGALYRVHAAGGTAVPLTHLNAAKSESNHLWPHFLPDGRHYLFQLVGLEEKGIFIGELDSEERTLLIPQPTFDLTSVAYASSGHLLFVRNHALMAQAFDAASMTLAGEPFRVAAGFGIGGPGRPRFAVSTTGVLVYRPVAENDTTQLEWVSRSGKDAQPVGPPGPYLGVDLSPDGSVAAVERATERDRNIWLIDLDRGSTSRFTSDVYAATPRFSPGGEAIAFTAIHDTPPNPVVRTMDGGEKRLARGASAAVITSWSPDGRWVVGQAVDVKTLSDVWLYPTDGKGSPKPFLRTNFDERAGAVSPNGTLMAFTSDDTGTTEVYIAAFPEPGRRLKVSTSSAGFPQWNGDGTELFFRVGQRVVSVAVPRQWTGELPTVGPERVLFTLPANVNAWTVSRDGQRFLINRRVAEAAEPRPEVVVNWASR